MSIGVYKVNIFVVSFQSQQLWTKDFISCDHFKENNVSDFDMK
jgi:hypothetical protein